MHGNVYIYIYHNTNMELMAYIDRLHNVHNVNTAPMFTLQVLICTRKKTRVCMTTVESVYVSQVIARFRHNHNKWKGTITLIQYLHV